MMWLCWSRGCISWEIGQVRREACGCLPHMYESWCPGVLTSARAQTLSRPASRPCAHPQPRHTLAGAYDKAAAENATSLFTMALRNVQSNIGGLASCLNRVAPASEAEPEDSADGPAEAFAPGPSP